MPLRVWEKKKKWKVDALNQSQSGALDKFVVVKKQTDDLVPVENFENEEFIDSVNEEHEETLDEEINQWINENDNEDDGSQHEDQNVEFQHSNIDDPNNWDKMDQNSRDFLVERGPKRRVDGVNYPKDDLNRHFSSTHYIQHLSNGEKHDRKWLVYSDVLDKVFYFCYKLFKEEGNKTLLANDGLGNWRNIGKRFKSHESSNEHLMCMSKWIELDMRLHKNETIDKSV